jgi:DNA polymerase-1
MPRAETLYLVDGSAQLHRAFFAIRGLATSRGLPTNAAYGFTTMLRKLLADEDPRLIGICFDPPGRTFRHESYAEYKAQRPKMDDALAVQVPYVRRLCDAFRLPLLEVPGYEADDVIATLADKAVGAGLKVVVVSGDKDLLQLVGDALRVLNPGREGSGSTLYDRAKVEEKFGVPPERVVDVLALVGDAVDNVPGVPGIGEKGARDLIREFGSLEAVLEGAERVKKASYREGLKAHAEEARLSKRLVTLRRDVPIELDLEALRRQQPDARAVHALFTELEFVSLAHEYAPAVAVVETEARVAREEAELAAAVGAAREAGRAALCLLLTSRDAMRADLVGAALAWAPGRALYVPLGHSPLEVPDAVPTARALELLAPLLCDASVRKLSAASKRDAVALARRGVALAGIGFDAPVACYLVNPGRRAYPLEEMALEYLGERRAGAGEVVSREAGLDAAARAAVSEADLVLRLEQPVLRRIGEEHLDGVYREMELPLIDVLAGMERAGVKVDAARLAAMGRDMERQLEALTREIYALAGREFNVNSPPQLREVLFERLGLKSGRKTAKTRAASTAEDVLEELAGEHELPRKILEYRGVQKLKSTYVDALPALIHSETGRIHATFHQTVAATGRISTSDPNLQNIPIRTAEGRRIREAFVAEPGHLLVSADYSQIELRVLAHLSGDPTLVETFRRGEDVHDRTAREVFGPFSTVPPDEQRRRSKMVNYALLYGKTAFSLAKDIGVGKKEAEAFIEAYFARYPGVRRFLDETIAQARQRGSVRTLLGRLRRLPDLHAKSFPVRMEAERQALNTPVQGSAADLIKRAMLDLVRELRAAGLHARLILQIHDELLLEAPEPEAERTLALARQVMEGALSLSVPLVVDARLGRNWAEAH